MAKDDGQVLGNLSWTPDGATIVYVRGGGPNRASELPNPVSLPEECATTALAGPLEAGAPSASCAR
jgi:hypothetical protein